jgi:tetratricopeptide (TPR) repeat protein
MQPRPATAAAIQGPTPVVTAVLQLGDGQIEAARATLRGVLAQDANQPDALILLSSVTLCSGEVEAATELAHRAVRLALEEPRAHAALAAALDQRGDAEGAIDAWRQVIVHDQLSAAAHTNLGALLQSRRQHALAWQACDTALSLNANLAPARFNRGLASIGLGRFTDAIADLRVAAKALPRQAKAWLGLGLALRRDGRHDEAVTALQRVLKLEPGHVSRTTTWAARTGPPAATRPRSPRSMPPWRCRQITSFHAGNCRGWPPTQAIPAPSGRAGLWPASVCCWCRNRAWAMPSSSSATCRCWWARARMCCWARGPNWPG